MAKTDLTGSWNVVGTSPEGEKITLCGTVPGSTLNDIINNDGGDAFYRDNAEKYQKYERYTWEFTKTFNVEKVGTESELVFERLDTYCDIYLNKKFVGKCINGNMEHRFDVTGKLVEGENTLVIYFLSPINMTLGKPERIHAFTAERLHTRRTQCTYGWDWTQRFVTCGMSGYVYVETREEPKEIKSAYVYTESIEEECAVIIAEVDFYEKNTKKIYDFCVQDKQGNVVKRVSKYCDEPMVKLYMSIEDAKLWWPFDYGDQNLYDFVIKQDDKVLYTTEFGIRKVVVIEIDDKEGTESYEKCKVLMDSLNGGRIFNKEPEFSSFILKVNGKKIFCKGFNWVPSQPFPMGNTDKKITQALELAKEYGVNMLRVWGGGAFESEHFYDECSRLGIMVTQDFLMACGAYPETEEWFIEELKKEACYAAELIRNKPCLMWWTGDNENASYGSDVHVNYSGRNSMYRALGPVIYKMDHSRRIFPSSPYGGNRYGGNTKGTTHHTSFLSDIFNYLEKDGKMDDYTEFFSKFNARFIAEEPCFGAAELDSLRKFMTDEDIFGDDKSMWYYHTKPGSGLKRELYDYFIDFTEKLMGKFKDGKDRFFKYKYFQYEWARNSIERCRREMWFCSGLIYWMYNDCWPAASGWSFIDYYNVPKAGLYSFKLSAQKIASSIAFENDRYNLYISNIGKEQKAKIKLLKVFEDKVSVVCQEDVLVKGESSYVYKTYNEELGPGEILVGEVLTENGDYSRCFYRPGDLEIEPADDSVKVMEITDTTVKIQANKYVHVVDIEGVSKAEDNYFFMLPGEIREIKIKKSADIKVNCYSFVK